MRAYETLVELRSGWARYFEFYNIRRQKSRAEKPRTPSKVSKVIRNWVSRIHAIDVTAPNRATIFEVWDNQEVLDKYFTYPYMDDPVIALSESSIRDDITNCSADIYDVSGKREMDFVLPTE